MAETHDAIDNMDAIVGVPSVEAVFFRPNDLLAVAPAQAGAQCLSAS